MQFYKHLLLCLVAIIAIFVIFASHLFLFPWFIHMPALAFLQGDTGDCPRPNDRADISLDFAVPSMLFLTETWEAISYYFDPIIGRRMMVDSHMRKCAFAALLTILMFPLLSLAEDKKNEPLKMKEGVSWSRVLKQSGLFLASQCSVRIAYEAETRVEFRGPYFKEYFESVRGLHGWDDGDTFPVNYLGHPWMGAVAGRIFVQNDAAGKSFDFRNDKLYWKSRLKALGWSAVYSATFELSPVGEAAIGNIGGKPWPDGMTYCDLVNTPVLGTGILIMEDLADRFVARWLEQRISFVPLTAFTRAVLNPARSMANVMRFKWPWHRDSRPGLRVGGQMRQSRADDNKE